MNVRERRAEIIRILMGRGRETMPQLAHELGVSISTIQRDILSLTVDEHYPIDTEKGNGGGVILQKFNHPYKHIFNQEQIDVLIKLKEVADERQKNILDGILRAYS